MLGPASIGGLWLGGWAGLWVAGLVFEPSERAGESLLGWLLENGFAFAVVLIPLLVAGAGIGWLAVQLVAGRVFNMRRTLLALAYQLVMGAVLVGPTLWMVDRLTDQPGSAMGALGWIVALLWAGGVPVISRYLALPRGEPV